MAAVALLAAPLLMGRQERPGEPQREGGGRGPGAVAEGRDRPEPAVRGGPGGDRPEDDWDAPRRVPDWTTELDTSSPYG